MAISKERLEELIKQGATIYLADRIVNAPIPIFLIEKGFVTKKHLSHEGSYVRDDIPLKDLYEEYKDAKWALKYHATRTEELNLPMWEDIVEHKDDDIYKIASFIRKNGMSYNLLFERGDLMLWSVQELMNVWIDLATEENYTKLCDLCIKLFNGEEE